MRQAWLVTTITAAVVLRLSMSGDVFAQRTQELVNDAQDTENVLTHSMGYARWSYSPLEQINKSNIKRLVPIWSTSVMNDFGELAAPVFYNGVMYVINGKWTFALDVATCRQIWRTPVELEPGTRGAPINRGAPALFNGKLFRVTFDNHLVALDMKTGEQLWTQKFAERKEGYYTTGAPIIANSVLISGMAGGESTTRGFLDGWDPETGKKLWRSELGLDWVLPTYSGVRLRECPLGLAVWFSFPQPVRLRATRIDSRRHKSWGRDSA